MPSLFLLWEVIMNPNVIDIDSLISQAYVHLYPEHVNSQTMSFVAASFAQAAQQQYSNATNKAIAQILNSTLLKINNKKVTSKEFMEAYGSDNLEIELEAALTAASEAMTKQFELNGDLTEAIDKIHSIIDNHKYINKAVLNEWGDAVWDALKLIGVNKDAYKNLTQLESLTQQNSEGLIQMTPETLDMINRIIKYMSNAEEKRKDKHGRLGKRSLRGTTQNIVGSQLGEAYGKMLIDNLDSNKLEASITDAIVSALKSPNVKISALNSPSVSRSGQKVTENTNSTVKPDIISDNGLFTITTQINNKTLSLDALVNSSVKEYRVNEPGSIHIISNTPITTVWKDQVSTKETLYGAYNAIAHSSHFQETYNNLKELIAGTYFTQYLMGSGQRIKDSNGIDTAWFMIIGKKAYSILDIVKDVVSSNPNSSTITIKFQGDSQIKNENVDIYNNVLQNALERSRKTKEAINKIKISATLNARFYK